MPFGTFRCSKPSSIGLMHPLTKSPRPGGGRPCGLQAFGLESGIIATYPRSGSGSQTLESFHSQWQALVKGQVQEQPTSIFSCMEHIYQREWADKFRWRQAMHFVTWPEVPAAALLNSDGLRGAGRPPAVDLWHHQKHDCGNRN